MPELSWFDLLGRSGRRPDSELTIEESSGWPHFTIARGTGPTAPVHPIRELNLRNARNVPTAQPTHGSILEENDLGKRGPAATFNPSHEHFVTIDSCSKKIGGVFSRHAVARRGENIVYSAGNVSQ